MSEHRKLLDTLASYAGLYRHDDAALVDAVIREARGKDLATAAEVESLLCEARAKALEEAADECEDEARTAEGSALQYAQAGDEGPDDRRDAQWWRNQARTHRARAKKLRNRASQERGTK